MFEEIISTENLLSAWREFLCGKLKKSDVREFSAHLLENILLLHSDLANGTYRHDSYHTFRINDPKPRDIAKASVRDRLLHHAIHRVLYPLLDRRFIADSFSCRIGKGTHSAMDRFRQFAFQVSRNHTRTCWVLKCDIRKFFASINHKILLDILRMRISDGDTLWLLAEIIGSFSPGLPLGNLTSQLFVNIYMNDFDQFAKHALKAKNYVRYADDFVVLSHDKDWLMELLPRMGNFLRERLCLELHPDKVSISTLASGVDFLGWVHFPDHRVIRTTTKRRMFRNLQMRGDNPQTVQSYLGLLGHGNTCKIKRELLSL